MDPVTGVVTINRNNAFNFEVQPEVTLQIEVRDKTTPPHVTYSSIVVTVEDLNDERPVWQLVRKTCLFHYKMLPFWRTSMIT